MSIKRYRPTLKTDEDGIVRASMVEDAYGEYVLYNDLPRREYEVDVTATIEMEVSDTLTVEAIDEENAVELAEMMAHEHNWDLYDNNGLNVTGLEVGKVIEI